MTYDTQTMITSVDVAYKKGYEDARGDEIMFSIESLRLYSEKLSRALPELAEGIQVASDFLIEQYELRSARFNIQKRN